MIYYSHVNEDNSIERNLLAGTKYNRCICIAGSGERFISLLDVSSCKEFICIDINKPALFLTKLKLTFLKHFSVSDYLKIIGYMPCSPAERIEAFKTISKHLDAKTFLYWNNKKNWISKGILHTGAFERFLARIRPILYLFLGKSFYKFTPEKKNIQNQFPKIRWFILKKIFGFKSVYRLFGNNDPAFVGKGVKLDFIPKVLDKQLNNGTVLKSFIFHLIFRGHFSEMDASDTPVSMQPLNLEKIKKRLEKEDIQISFVRQDLLEYVTSIKQETVPVFISVSDILSFVSFEYVEKLADLLVSCNFMLVFRSFLKNRVSETELSGIARKGFKYKNWSSGEKSGMYQVFSLSANGSA